MHTIERLPNGRNRLKDPSGLYIANLGTMNIYFSDDHVQEKCESLGITNIKLELVKE